MSARAIMLFVAVLGFGMKMSSAAAAELDAFFGAYVGVARAEGASDAAGAQRDMDVVIRPYDDDGFRIDWITVTLVDGRRDLPGVKRQSESVLFRPAEGRSFFVEVPPNNPFRERKATRPVDGDPIRWARLKGNSLLVSSFVVLEDGRYELQLYDRVLTKEGLDIRFEAMVDSKVIRRVTGKTMRARR